MTELSGAMLSIPTPDGTADAYLSTPTTNGGAHPAILFYTDLVGLRPVMKKMADRLAAAGYAVLVPNVFYRTGPAPIVEMPEVVTAENLWPTVYQGLEIAQQLSPEEAMRDAKVWLDWLDNSPLTTGGGVGITGYCFGGMLSLRTAGNFPDRVVGSAIVHGSHLVTDAPDSPHLVADRIKAEVFLANGDADTITPPEQIDQLVEVLAQAGVGYTSEMYPGAQHAFTASDLKPLYDETADERHWAGLFELFGKVLPSEAGR